MLRQFCRVYLERVPDDTTLIRWAGCVGAGTLERLHARSVELAQQHPRVARTLRLYRGDLATLFCCCGISSPAQLLCDLLKHLGSLIEPMG